MRIVSWIRGPREPGAPFLLMDRARIFLFLLALLGVPLVFTWRTYNSFEAPKAFVFEGLTILIAVITIIGRIFGHGVGGGRMPLGTSVALFVLWAWASLLWSMSPGAGIQSLALLTAGGIFSVLSYGLLHDARLRNTAALCLIASAGIASLIGILQYFGLDFTQGIRFSLPERPLNKYEIYSTIGHPNFLGSFLASILPLALTGVLSPHPRWQRCVGGISGAAMLLCLPLLRAKGPWLGVIVSMAFFTLFEKKGRKALAVGLISLLPLIIILSVTWMEWNFILKSLSPSYVSNRVRVLMWAVTARMITDHPIVGLGFGSYGRHYQPYLEKFLGSSPDPAGYDDVIGETKNAHNDLLQLTAETGVIGLGLFLWVLGRFFIRTLGKNRKEGAEGRPLALASACGVLSLLITSLVEFPLSLPATTMSFWFLLGLGTVCPREAEDTTSHPRALLPRGTKTAVAVLAAFSGFYLVFMSFRPVAAEAIHRDLYDTMLAGRYADAVPLAHRGIRWDPYNEDLHLILGSAYIYTGRFGEAREEFSTAENLFPGYMTLYDMGLVYFSLKEYSKAEEYFRRARDFSPITPDAYRGLIQVYTALGKTEDIRLTRERLMAKTGRHE